MNLLEIKTKSEVDAYVQELNEKAKKGGAGLYNAELEKLEAYINANPNNFWLLLIKALVLEETGKLMEAGEVYDTILPVMGPGGPEEVVKAITDGRDRIDRPMKKHNTIKI